ncbi:MAG: voltage-gated chloride channel family protein [Verrucomicrobiota bacterium]
MPESSPNQTSKTLDRRILRTSLLVVPLAMVAGSAVAFFLWSLDLVTQVRFERPWLLYFLPLAGVLVGYGYHRWGKSVEGGNNLIMEQIHEPGGGVPTRMAPLVLLGTLITHLFGGSAGREGTAVQMGGSMASAWARYLKLGQAEVRILLMAGIAAGFGAVFGTPLAGAVFAMEVLVIRRFQYDAWLPCLIAAMVGDWACQVWGIGHTHYQIGYAGTGMFKVDGVLWLKVVLAAVAFGMVSALFAELCHMVHAFFKKHIASPVFRPAMGGVVVILLTWLLGTHDYLGLGVSSPDPNAVTLVSFFHSTEVHPWNWWWKIVFTVVTLASGFKGGEVTPLFFIGAALGNALSGLLGGPPDLFAALGFIAVFAGATNTPIACTLMGIELFGAEHSIYFATACVVAYLSSGHSGIYLSQRIGRSKHRFSKVTPGMTLRQWRDKGGNAKEDGDADK